MKFLALSLSTTVAVLILGYLPTIRLAGKDAITEMVAGCCISFVASLIGMIPVWLAQRNPSGNIAMAVLASTVVRLFVAMVLSLSIALSGLMKITPLLLWVAISYLVLLLTDTVYAVQLSKSRITSKT